MISYRVYCDASKTSKDGSMPVIIIFEQSGKRAKVSTGIRTSHKFSGSTFPSEEKSARQKTAALARIITIIEDISLSNINKSFDEVVYKIKSSINQEGQTKPRERVFTDYVLDYARTTNNEATKKLYEYTARKIEDYDKDATFNTITPEWLRLFEAHLLKTMSINGISIRLRNIRTVFNWAINNEWTEAYPFRKFKIKQQKVTINNISVVELRKLRDYPVEDWQKPYRDFFMLSFYLCGINPVDLLQLRKTDMHGGRIRYTRQKTGKLYNIPVPQEAADIINRYSGHGDYLLSFIEGVKDYHYFAQHCNKAIKKIGPYKIVLDKVGKLRKIEYHPLFPKITLYSARYTFASIGAELDIPRETIALCLGHSWADVTSHYIAYNYKKVDEAVDKILDYVR